MKLFTLAASLRTNSLNQKLISLAAQSAREAGAEVTEITFDDIPMPFYDNDIQDNDGFPEGAQKLKALLDQNDGFIIASPEYNHSFPGILKNAIDWASRFRPVPFNNKHVLLLSASPSLVGGNRGLWQLRTPLATAGCHVYPNMFSLARAQNAFDEHGALHDNDLQSRLNSTIASFVEFASRS